MVIKEAFFIYQLSYSKDIEWHNRLHKHDNKQYELHYFLQGEGTYKSGSTVYNISRGALFLTAPNELHSITSTNIKRPLTYYALLIEVDDSDKEAASLLTKELKNSNYYNIGTNYRFFFEELKDHGLSKRENLQKSAKHQLLSFLYRLIEIPEEINVGEQESIHIEKALKIMQNSVLDEITLGEIAQKLNLNDSYFIRLFKKKMKITPMKYYTKLKIEAASSMLLSTSDHIYEIASKLHFYSEFHFSRVFKNHTGVSPREYRKKYTI